MKLSKRDVFVLDERIYHLENLFKQNKENMTKQDACVYYKIITKCRNQVSDAKSSGECDDDLPGLVDSLIDRFELI